jgi:hypothetical protein
MRSCRCHCHCDPRSSAEAIRPETSSQRHRLQRPQTSGESHEFARGAAAGVAVGDDEEGRRGRAVNVKANRLFQYLLYPLSRQAERSIPRLAGAAWVTA